MVNWFRKIQSSLIILFILNISVDIKGKSYYYSEIGRGIEKL